MSKPYDPTLRQTEHGSKLYSTWRKITKSPHCDDWSYFPAFYEWAMQNGYEIGSWLKREDTDGPFSPQNCFWYFPHEKGTNFHKEDIDKWNKTVNRIRKYYGMPPLEGTKYGN